VGDKDRTELEAQVSQSLAALTEAVDMEEPDPAQVAKLKELLEELPWLWACFEDVNAKVQRRLIHRMHRARSGAMALTKGIEVMRQDLGHPHATPLERVLIDHVLTCWLRLQDVEWGYSITVGSGESMAISQADWWERRLSAAQRRYLRACETLARVRKLIRRTTALQVNIAAHGGQQVNVVGDVEAG
jgi:hypothetical protein